MIEPSPPPPAPPGKEILSVFASLSLVSEIGFLIALPAVAFGMGGAFLDKRMHSSPIFVILGLVVALCASGFAVYRKVKSVIL